MNGEEKKQFFLLKGLYFFLFTGYGVLYPYMPVFFESLSFSKSRIGILSMIPNLASFFVAPLFSILGDKFLIHCEIIMFSIIFSTIGTLAMLFTRTYRQILFLVTLTAILRAPLTPQVDSLVMSLLPDRKYYGEMRLWGAISFGIFSFIGGWLSPVESEESQDILDGDNLSYRWVFYIYTFALFFSGFNILAIILKNTKVLGIHGEEEGVHIISALGEVFYEHPLVGIFSVVVFLSGFGSGVIDAFLFIRLRQLGGSGLLMGVSRFITCAAEVPMFQIAGTMQKKYGTWPMMLITQIAFVIRFSYYSTLVTPWAVLPCEVLHGLTFATMWSVSCTYANMIAPKDCHSTMQALLEGLHWGLGSGLGSLVGGFVYDYYGAVRLFQISALLSAISSVMTLLVCIFHKRDREETNEYEKDKHQYAKLTLGEFDDSDENFIEVIEFNTSNFPQDGQKESKFGSSSRGSYAPLNQQAY